MKGVKERHTMILTNILLALVMFSPVPTSATERGEPDGVQSDVADKPLVVVHSSHPAFNEPGLREDVRGTIDIKFKADVKFKIEVDLSDPYVKIQAPSSLDAAEVQRVVEDMLWAYIGSCDDDM